MDKDNFKEQGRNGGIPQQIGINNVPIDSQPQTPKVCNPTLPEPPCPPPANCFKNPTVVCSLTDLFFLFCALALVEACGGEWVAEGLLRLW
jgi:hypothetical protein